MHEALSMAIGSYSTTVCALLFLLQYVEEHIEQAGCEFRRAEEFDEGGLGERRPVLYLQATDCAVEGFHRAAKENGWGWFEFQKVNFLIDCDRILSEKVTPKELVRALWSTRAATLNLRANRVQD